MMVRQFNTKLKHSLICVYLLYLVIPFIYWQYAFKNYTYSMMSADHDVIHPNNYNLPETSMDLTNTNSTNLENQTVSLNFMEFPSVIHNCNIYHRNNDKINIYDCTKNAMDAKHLTIAIASFHHYSNGNISKYDNILTRHEQLILSNHIAYTMQHEYIYFDIDELLFNDNEISAYMETNIDAKKYAMYKLQKPFIIHSILNDSIWGKVIDYVLWIDFDVIFYECALSVQHLLHYTHALYSPYSERNTSMDIIFSRDYSSLSNSGVVLYKNTEWAKQLLFRQMFVFKNANKLQFASIVYGVRGLIDQNVFNALLLGYDPFLYNNWNDSYNALSKTLKREKKLHKVIENFRDRAYIIDNEEHCMYIHNNYLAKNIRKHSAMIPQIKINLLYGQWKWAKKNEKNKTYQPFILHFAAFGKNHIQYIVKRHRKLKTFRKCYLKYDAM